MDIKNIIIGVLVVAVALTSVAFAYKDAGDTNIPVDEPEKNNKATIRVSGDSLIKVEPDIVHVYVKIETEGYTAEEAKKENNRISEDVTEALEFSYVEGIETDYFSIREKDFEVTSAKRYVATNVLKVTTKDINWAGKITDKAINNGATGIKRIDYELSEEKGREVKKKALKKASEDAYEKAKAIAEGLGKEIGDLISVEESDFIYEPYNYFLEAESIRDAGVETEILPEDLEVTASVTLVYEIK